MGLRLYPEDGGLDGPDACFSYREFSAFRRRLAAEEGFPLESMEGFGGETPWSDVTTVLEPLLNHPDDHGRNLSVDECARMLPRLEIILSRWAPRSDSDRELQNQVEELSDLVTVLRVCKERKVELSFA